MTGDEAARRLGWSSSKISRIELQRTGIKQADLRKLLDLYKVGEPHRTDLIALARESTGKDRLKAATVGFPAGYAEYVHAEAEASSVWNWEPQIVPGLLQIPDYARAAMAGMQTMFARPPGDLERRIQTRLMRQQRLSGDHPLELAVVVDESVLYRTYGDANVLRCQLDQLVVDSQRPNVDLRVLPLQGRHPISTGAFAYMRFPRVHEVPLRDLVSVEHLDGSYYLDEEAQTHGYRVTFKYLMEQSLSPEQSRDLIATGARRT